MAKLEVQGRATPASPVLDADETANVEQAAAESAEQDSVENENNEIVAPSDSRAEELALMREQNEMLQTKISQLIDSLSPKQQRAVTKSPAELAEEYKTDPIAVIKNIIQSEVSTVKSDISQDHTKKIWDAKAERDFPQMATDPAFQREVKKAFAELTSDGEYSRDHPKVVYRAVERAAARYAANTKKQAPTNKGMSSEAPKSGSQANKRTPAADKTFDTLVEMFGIRDKAGMLEKYNSFKSKKGRG